MTATEERSEKRSLKSEIRRLMRLAKINSQAELADETGLNPATISRLFSGKIDLDVQHIEKLQAKLGETDEFWDNLQEKGEDTQKVDEKYLKAAFEKGNPAYEVEYAPGKYVKIPAILALNSPRDAGRIAAEFIKGLSEGGLEP